MVVRNYRLKPGIANLEEKHQYQQNFKFLVGFDNGDTQEYTTGDIRGGSNSLWKQYGFDFFVPQGLLPLHFPYLRKEPGTGVRGLHWMILK